MRFSVEVLAEPSLHLMKPKSRKASLWGALFADQDDIESLGIGTNAQSNAGIASTWRVQAGGTHRRVKEAGAFDYDSDQKNIRRKRIR